VMGLHGSSRIKPYCERHIIIILVSLLASSLSFRILHADASHIVLVRYKVVVGLLVGSPAATVLPIASNLRSMNLLSPCKRCSLGQAVLVPAPAEKLVQ
jgi:hypothetical protein